MLSSEIIDRYVLDDKLVPAAIVRRSVDSDMRGQVAARFAPTFPKPVRAAVTRGKHATRDVAVFASADSSVASTLVS